MRNKRDNLILIAAFAAAIALHAVMLPWVGAAVGDVVEERATIDLVVEQLSVEAYPTWSDQYGEYDRVIEIDVDSSIRVDNLALAQSQLSASDTDRTDAVWLSRDRRIDAADVQLHEVFVPGIDVIESISGVFQLLPYPESTDGPHWLIYQADVHEQVPDADRSNNTRSVPIYIDGPQRPELAIKTFNAPDRAASGGSVLIDFAIENVGDGWASSNPKLGEHGWADRVYLSVDDRLDATDVSLRTFDRATPLGPGGEYRHESVELELPRNVTGPMHLILVADSDQLLDQPSFTKGFAVKPIDLVATDEPDLIVASIQSPSRFVLTRPAPLSFTIANLGSVPTFDSNWTDGLYLSNDDQLDQSDLLITAVNASQPLQPRSRYETSLEVTLPDTVEPGRHFLIIKADADNLINEAVFEDNNTFAIPIDVLTPEQADAEIKLGDPDRPERLVVQWIENERFEEHIARLSRTVQPALQSQAEPDPDAPLVDNPKPPALAAVDDATGNPDRPTPPTDPVQPNTNPPPPDATQTDVAPRPKTESSPNQTKLDGLPGDAGTLNPNRPGIDGPLTPNLPNDPTPNKQDKPTPMPGDRDVPSPADPTAPDTETKTDSDSPSEIESDTDSDNPEKTETDTPKDPPTEEQTTDPTATPKPDTQDAPKPDGKDGDPATPSEEQTPTRAPKDDSEAPPTDIKITELELQEGQVLVGKGIKVTTKLPTPPGTGSRVLSIPRNARVSITFDNKGNVYKAKIIRTTTYKEWDAAIEASLYRWSAKGEAIDNAKPHITIEWDYLLNDLFGDDE